MPYRQLAGGGNDHHVFHVFQHGGACQRGSWIFTRHQRHRGWKSGPEQSGIEGAPQAPVNSCGTYVFRLRLIWTELAIDLCIVLVKACVARR
eukprot:2081954-Rhodomonas_salina.2